jgi:hypothetical protein
MAVAFATCWVTLTQVGSKAVEEIEEEPIALRMAVEAADPE